MSSSVSFQMDLTHLSVNVALCCLVSSENIVKTVINVWFVAQLAELIV